MKDKELTRLALFFFFFDLSRCLNMVRVIEVKTKGK